jgi:hypothetical protein
MGPDLATALCALDATRAQAMATIALRDCFELILGLLESPGCLVEACGVARASMTVG